MTVTNEVADTPRVVTEKFALVEPAGIVSDVGVLTERLAELRLITAPPVGAAVASVTVPTLVFVPPTTDEGAIETEVRLAGLTVSVHVAVSPLIVAEIVTA